MKTLLRIFFFFWKIVEKSCLGFWIKKKKKKLVLFFCFENLLDELWKPWWFLLKIVRILRTFLVFLEKSYECFENLVAFFENLYVIFKKVSSLRVWDAGQYFVKVQGLEVRETSSRSMWDFLVNRGDAECEGLKVNFNEWKRLRSPALSDVGDFLVDTCEMWDFLVDLVIWTWSFYWMLKWMRHLCLITTEMKIFPSQAC